MKTAMIKQTVIGLMAAGLTLGSAQAVTQVDELSQELEIMTSILNTSLKQGGAGKGIQFRGLDVTYLARQGVVFEVKTSNGGLNFNFGQVFSNAFSFSSSSSSDVERDVVIKFDEHEIQDMVRQAKRLEERAREKLRELREDERELSWEQREFDRRRRDIEFEKRHADEKRRKKLNEKLKELDKEAQQLVSRKKEIAEFATQLETEQKQEAEKRNQAKKEQYKRFLAGFEENIASTLCKYGSGLKSLDSGENVSFVLKNFGSASGRGKNQQDKIYVFAQKDIRACVTEKIDSNKLLTNARTYMF